MAEGITKVATILRDTRKSAGQSQENMALELGVARRTVQNWEKGTSEPTAGQLLGWFEVLGVSPFPHLLEYMYPSMENLTADDDVERLDEAIQVLLKNLPEDGMRQLLYLFYGTHGSSPKAVMNMITAHLQSPMRDRIAHASAICLDYELACKESRITDKTHVQPDVETIKAAIEAAKDAIVKGTDSYGLL